MHKYIKCINTSVHIHVTIKMSDYLSCNCILHYFIIIYLFLPVFSLHILSLATLGEQEAAAQKHRQFPFLFLIFVPPYYVRNISPK